MANIHFSENRPANLKCFACGEIAQAVWWGHQTTGICYPCATEVLPKLLADATVTSEPTTLHSQKVWDKSAGAYWYAVAANIQCSRERLENAPESSSGD